MARRSSKSQTEYDRLLKEYKKLAKRADQRLVRLENLSKEQGFSGVKNWAYGVAQKAIRRWSGSEGIRFNTKAPSKMQALRAKIRDIKSFLSSVTSTKSGITKVYKKRAATLNKNNGTNFSWEDVGKFFESAEYEKMEREYGSDTAVKTIGVIQNNEDELLESIREKRNYNLKIDNKKVKKTLDNLIEEYGLKITDLY